MHPMPGVTISASYGTGGRAVARAVSSRLNLPMLDRAISADVAQKLHVSVREAEGGAVTRSLVDRFLSALAPLADGALGTSTHATQPSSLAADRESALFRDQADDIMRDAMATGAVILGRGGGAAFSDEPEVLRVRLFGRTDARLAHAATAEGIDQSTARQRLTDADRARAHYVKRLYGRNIDDPDLYQLQIDSTILSAEATAELIATAYLALNPA
jgi:cytidylate kinase